MAANTEYTKIKESTISAFFTKLKAFFWPKSDVVNVNLADVAVTGDYDDLINKPDLSQFITKSVNDLVNYYTKSQTYTQTEVNSLIGAIQQFHYEIVATLPATGAGNILYLLGPTGSGSDKYEEYVYANSTWTKIGDTSIDLSGYVTTTALNTALADYTTTANLTTLLAGKQDTISDLATIRSGAAAGATAYQKPSGGIPKSDLASAVQTSLGKADTALQSFTETDPTVPAWAKTANPPTEVFIAEYNVTPFADIYAAYQAGKSILVEQGGTFAVLTDIGSSSASFAQPMGAGKMWECFSVSQTGGWSRSWEEIVDVTNLSQLSDDATHRLVTDTEKATWNAKYDKPSDGIPASDLASGVIPSVPVQDVEVDGVSVLNDGVAEIPAIPTTYAGSATAGGAADKALGIPYGEVDSDSTATDIKASVDNFPTTLVAGVCAYIRNDVVSSASGFTLNINGTGAKPVYASNADASRVTTLFSAATTFLFVYNPTRVSGGCWDMYYGYNANDNTIGYMLRTNGAVPPTASKFYRYRLLFTSDDYQSLIPANTSSSTNATAARAVNQAKINPFAPIYYYSNTTAVDAGVSPGASYVWLQYSGITLGYSFNRTGSALTMTAKDPVFLKCAPQADGSAIMDADTPIVQALPSTEDGNIYIYLGIAESATAITLYYWHPIYWYKDGAIRQWTNAKEIVVDSVPTQGSTNPVSSGGVKAALDGKQDTLESGVNIKTINNQSLLGSGNIDIQGGGKSIEDVSSADVTLAAQVGKSYIWSVIPTSMNIQLPANPADGSEIEMRFLTGSATLPTISFGSTRILWPGGEISLMLDAVHLLKFNYSALGGWACDCLVCYSPFPALPEGYTAYLWIGKTTGTGYINTGYAPKTKPRVTTSLMKIGAIPDADLFGSNGSPLFIFNPGQTAAGNVLFSFYYKYGNKSSGNITGVTFNEFVWYDVDAKEDITFGGQLYSWATEWDYSSNSANIFIFGGRNFSGSNIRMKRTRIYDGDTLVRDLCPCTDPDGNPGMYDLVTEAFYGCAIAGQPLEVGN